MDIITWIILFVFAVVTTLIAIDTKWPNAFVINYAIMVVVYSILAIAWRKKIKIIKFIVFNLLLTGFATLFVFIPIWELGLPTFFRILSVSTPIVVIITTTSTLFLWNQGDLKDLLKR